MNSPGICRREVTPIFCGKGFYADIYSVLAFYIYHTEADSQIRRWNSAFLLLLIVLKKQKTKMVWSYISQFSINKTGHFFHLTSLKFSDMKEAHTFGLRNSLFMAFFSLQYSITRKVGCCFSVKKSWDINFLLSFFLFSSSRPVITFNCQKSAFLVPTQGTLKLFSEKYYWVFRFRTPELNGKFLFIFYFFSFCPALSSNFEMSKCRKLNF